jgi:membrane fusion protein (multidrug efflux system)
VQAAEARVAQARLDLERTVVRAPVDGVVTRRNVQVGQRVAPGGVLMLVVPVGQLYVDANFKEGQLAKVKSASRSRSRPISTAAA